VEHLQVIVHLVEAIREMRADLRHAARIRIPVQRSQDLAPNGMVERVP
jgi:hypothetical protein